LFTLIFKWPVRYVQVIRIASADDLNRKTKKSGGHDRFERVREPTLMGFIVVMVEGEELR